MRKIFLIQKVWKTCKRKSHEETRKKWLRGQPSIFLVFRFSCDCSKLRVVWTVQGHLHVWFPVRDIFCQQFFNCCKFILFSFFFLCNLTITVWWFVLFWMRFGWIELDLSSVVLKFGMKMGLKESNREGSSIRILVSGLGCLSTFPSII